MKVNSNKRRVANALLVGTAGAVVGALIGLATYHGCPPQPQQSFCFDIGGKALPAAVGAAIGGVGAIAIGAVLPARNTIYDSSVH